MKNIFGYLLILLCGCSTNNHQTFDYETALEHLKNEIKESGDFFKKGELINQVELIINKDSSYNIGNYVRDSLRHEWRSKKYYETLSNQLSFQEPEKFTINDDIEIYKFKYTRAFSNEEVRITISKQDTLYSFKVQNFWTDRECNQYVGSKRVNGSCFKIIDNEQKKISKTEWKIFKKLIADADYWNLNTNREGWGLDGSMWLLEGSKKTYVDKLKDHKQIYKVVMDWSPKKESAFRKIGVYLMEKSGKDFGEIY